MAATKTRQGPLKRSLFATAAEALTRVGVLICFAIYFPVFGDARAVQTITSFTVVSTVWLFVDLGMSSLGIARISTTGDDSGEFTRDLVSMRFALSTIGFFLAVVVQGILLDIPWTISVSTALYLPIRSLSTEWRLRGEARFQELSVIASTNFVAQMLVLVAVLATRNWSLLGAAPILAYPVVDTLLTARATKTVPLPKFTRSMFTIVKGSWRHSAAISSVTLYGQLQLLVLAAIITAEELGGFALLSRLAISSNIVFQATAVALIPELVAAQERRQSIRNPLLRLGSFVVPLLSLVFGILSLVADSWLSPEALYTFPVAVLVGSFSGLRGVREVLMRGLLVLGRELVLVKPIALAAASLAATLLLGNALGLTAGSLIGVSTALLVALEVLIIVMAGRSLQQAINQGNTPAAK